MTLNDFAVHVKTCLFFEIVNILRHILPQNLLVLEHLDEVVRGSRVVLA